MEDLLKRIRKAEGVTVVHFSPLKKSNGWRKWKTRNVVLARRDAEVLLDESEDEEDRGRASHSGASQKRTCYEIYYTKAKDDSSDVTQIELSSASVVKSVADDRLNTVFLVQVKPDGKYGLKFAAPNSKDKLIWIQKLRECIASMTRERRLSTDDEMLTRSPLHSPVMGSRKSFSHSDASASDIGMLASSKSMADLRDKNVVRGFSLNQLAHEIKLQRGKKQCLLRDNYRNSTVYRDSFGGAELIDWLIRNGFESNRRTALDLGQSMIASGLISHVSYMGKNLEDSNDQLYHLLESHETKLLSLKKMTKRLHHHVEELDLQMHQIENTQETTLQRARLIDRESDDMHFNSTLTIFVLSLALFLQGFTWDVKNLSLSGVISIVLCSLYGKRALQMWQNRDRRHRALSIAVPAITAQQSGRRGGTKRIGASKHEKKDLRLARKLTKRIIVSTKGGMASKHSSDDDDDESTKSGLSHTYGESDKTLYQPYDEDEGVTIDCWSQPDGSNFKVRGVTYLSDGIKVASAQSTHQLLAVHLCRVDTKIDHVANKTSQFSDILGAECAIRNGGMSPSKSTGSLDEKMDSSPPASPMNASSKDASVCEYFIIQFQVPGYSMSCYFKLRPSAMSDPVFMSLYRRFVDGDDDFRNSRIKIIPMLIEGGGYMVRRMISGKPALLGKKIQCEYFRGHNYLEMDIDISSSYAAGVIMSSIRGVTKKLTIDLAFTIQGNSDLELPERILGAGRFCKVDLGNKPMM